MRFQLTLDCDNDAFRASPHGEVARILTVVSDKLMSRLADGMTLLDANGNTVGEATFTGEWEERDVDNG